MGQNPRVLILRHEDVARRGAEGGQPGGQTRPRRGQPRARAWGVSGPTKPTPTPPLRPYILRIGKTLGTRANFLEKIRSRRHPSP